MITLAYATGCNFDLEKIQMNKRILKSANIVIS